MSYPYIVNKTALLHNTFCENVYLLAVLKLRFLKLLKKVFQKTDCRHVNSSPNGFANGQTTIYYGIWKIGRFYRNKIIVKQSWAMYVQTVCATISATVVVYSCDVMLLKSCLMDKAPWASIWTTGGPICPTWRYGRFQKNTSIFALFQSRYKIGFVKRSVYTR